MECIVIQQNTEKQIEDLKELQAKLKQMSADARDKDLLYKQLVCNDHFCDNLLTEYNTQCYNLKLYKKRLWFCIHVTLL